MNEKVYAGKKGSRDRASRSKISRRKMKEESKPQIVLRPKTGKTPVMPEMRISPHFRGFCEAMRRRGDYAETSAHLLCAYIDILPQGCQTYQNAKQRDCLGLESVALRSPK